MSDWQPIDSAPKDGTVIDVWVRGERVPDVYWSTSRNAETGEIIPSAYDCWAIKDRFVGSGGAYPLSVSGEPTHWMPLPEPPKDPSR